MGKSHKQSTVGYQYSFGMHALLGLRPLTRIVRIFTDNQDLVTTPTTGGTLPISAPGIYTAGEINDGVAGKLKLHLNGSPAFDAYLLAGYGIDPTLVPRFDAAAHVVFSSTRTVAGSDPSDLASYWEDLGLESPTIGDIIEAGDGPFYFGNTPYPREFMFIGEGAETSCPFGEFALLPYTHEDWAIVCNDYNPLVMYWEIFIRDDPDSYGDTWAAAAEVVFDEGIGIYFNGGGGDLEALEREIARYVNGKIYTDRQTGLREIQLIRNDFDVADLVVITEADLIGEPDLVLPDRSIFSNTIDATFTDRRKKFDSGTVGVQDGAHVAAYGVSRSEGDYAWATSRELCVQLASRDLVGITGAGITGSVRLSGLRPDLHNGSPFILSLASYDVAPTVCRIVSIEERGLRDNSVDVQLLADSFGVRPALTVLDDLPGSESTLAQPAVNQMAFEVPYYLGLLIGGEDFPNESESNEAFGALGLVVQRPNSRHIAYTIAVDTGTGYRATGTGQFNTYSTLASPIERMTDTITVAPLFGIDVNSILMIGGVEFVRINAIDVSGVTSWELEIGRGCIDTAPVPHDAGASVWRVFDASTDGVSYLDGQELTIAVMTQTTSNILPATDATPLELELASRAIRPYPPGRVKIDGTYPDNELLSGIYMSDTAEITWVARNRLLQTDETFIEDHDDAGITAEAGTTYRITIESFDEDMTSLGISLDNDVGAVLTYTTGPGDFAAGAIFARASVYAVRDGYDSWTAPGIIRPYSGGLECDETGVPITTEDGEFIILE